MILRLCIVGLVSMLGLGAQAVQRPTDLVNKETTGRVVGVTDGDTLDILIPPKRRLRVRLHGVDAPEAAEPFSQQARNFLRVLMFSRDVIVRGRDVDSYGRLVARIVVDGVDASEGILLAGLACHYRRYSDDAKLEAAEQSARTNKRGFWAQSAQQPACVAREANALSASAPRQPIVDGFIGNVSSRVFHLPSCKNASCKNCTRRFATRQEAEAAGFRPAGDCLRRFTTVRPSR